MTLLGQPFLASSKALTAGTLSVAMAAPFFIGVEPATATSFSDVSFGYWARPFIEKLAQYSIVDGYSDGSFRPEEPMTRAQFSQLLDRALGSSSSLVQSPSWYDEQPLSRMQALVMVSNRLDLEPKHSVNSTLSRYKDAIEIPRTAREGIAAATENEIVVNYPNVKLLMPYQSMTRADASAFIHQALVHQGQVAPIDSVIRTSRYIVEYDRAFVSTPSTSKRMVKRPNRRMEVIPAGTKIPLQYPNTQDVNLVITPDETYQTTLSVSTPIIDQEGDVLIPKGSQIEGQFVPIKIDGEEPATQFVAERLVLDGKSYPIRATSNPRMAVSQSDVEPDDLETSIASAAARSIVRSIEGKPSSLGSIFSEAFGLNKRRSPEASIIMIEPNSLVLTMQSRLRVAS